MNFAFVYLVHRAVYRVGDFFHHWYIDASRYFAHGFITFLEGLDKTFAVRITLRYFFQPLYKDYTIVGRILGVVFRTWRLLLGILVYVFFGALFLIFYAVWFLVPPIIIYAFVFRRLPF